LPLAKLACAPTLIILWVLANDWVMANDLDDLDGAKAIRSRRMAPQTCPQRPTPPPPPTSSEHRRGGSLGALMSYGEIGLAWWLKGSLCGRFGLLELATGHGLGETPRLASIQPPLRPLEHYEHDHAHDAEQDEGDSQDHHDPQPYLRDCPHLPCSGRALTVRRTSDAVQGSWRSIVFDDMTPIPDGGNASAECGRVNSLSSEDGTYTASE
jgi:hypothetical protein